MAINGMRKKRIIAILFIAVCLIFWGLIVENSFFYTGAASADDIEIRSEDNDIVVGWEKANVNIFDDVVITISDGNGEKLIYEIPSYKKQFHFKNGKHGILYSINVSILSRDGSSYSVENTDRLFLNHAMLPDLPLLNISTADGKDPECQMLYSPEDMFGVSITNNYYKPGVLELSGTGIKSMLVKLNIRCRGNSSSSENNKKQYKLELSDPYDFLDDGSGKCKDWVLLNAGDDLNIFTANKVIDLCELSWETEAGFVNVILNGDWKGCYYLTRSVGKESAKDLVSDTGFIVEDDLYFWKDNTVYFKTKAQIPQFGWTLKYPRVRNADDPVVKDISSYMQCVEDSIVNDLNFQDYIDQESFAKCMLVRDIMGVDDWGGSNYYYYLYALDVNDPQKYKLYMGPLWDWDTSFRTEGFYSACRETSFFQYLLVKDSFFELYTGTYKKISGIITDEIDNELDILEKEHGNALDESWKLDYARWGEERNYVSFAEQRESVSRWMEERVSWMDIFAYLHP